MTKGIMMSSSIAVVLLFLTECALAQHTLLLRDEGMSKLSYVNTADQKPKWQVDVPQGRDLQLVGQGRVLIGTGNGYEEREISSGQKVNEATNYPGTIAARRLSNGNTMLIGVNWQGKDGIVLVEINNKHESVRTINFPGFTYARLFRLTAKGTFLVTADKVVFEGDVNGNIIWRAEVEGHNSPHAWQALRLGTGETIVSTGFADNLQFFSDKGILLRKINAPEDLLPHFFAGFQILTNGNFVVTNWQGHGPSFGSQGTQLLEFDPKGRLVWTWLQDPVLFSSLQGVIVLDGLDLQRMHVEDARGVLVPNR